MPNAPFPHVYQATLEGNMLLAGTRTPVLTGAPSQFGGTDDVWSPEQLLVAAALTCLKTTFDAYARHAGISVIDWRGTGTGVLVKGHAGPFFDSIDLDVEVVTGSGEEGRAQALLAKAARDCIISRALSAPVHVKSKVSPASDRAAS
ncbi:MAG: OsmC-like protein [Deltaproteobacteria bacterium]|nr:OsmC-like protein [Deltaproteobacteria bacterium]